MTAKIEIQATPIKQTTYNRPRRWRRVEMDELEALWDARRAAGTIFNGCTHVDLHERYGSDVKHVMGRGWYKLTKE